MPVQMDFSLILIIATAITGLIWFSYVFFFKKKGEIREKDPLLVDYSRAFFPILLIVLILRSFLVEPFHIPSGSMKPTLLTGDFILVNKYIYGLRLPVISKKLVKLGSPQRGDIIVFRHPNNPSMDLIKRVVGVPGDTIAYRNKVLYVNGTPQEQVYQGKDVDREAGFSLDVTRYIEKLQNHEHAIYLRPIDGQDMKEVVVPEGKFFVSGDNRDNSDDSRAWGFVEDRNIKGKAFFVWMSFDPIAKDIRWNRIGTKIQ